MESNHIRISLCCLNARNRLALLVPTGVAAGGEDHTGGVASLATGPPHQAFVAEVRKSLEAILAVVDKNKDDVDAMKAEVEPEAAKLGRLLTAGPAAKTAETRRGE